MSAKRYIPQTVSRSRMYEVIRAPLITEKTTNGSEHSQVTFKVAADATKPQTDAMKPATATGATDAMAPAN